MKQRMQRQTNTLSHMLETLSLIATVIDYLQPYDLSISQNQFFTNKQNPIYPLKNLQIDDCQVRKLPSIR